MDAQQVQWKITFGEYYEAGGFSPSLLVTAQKVTLDSDSPYVFYVDGLRMESSLDVVEIEHVEEDGE